MIVAAILLVLLFVFIAVTLYVPWPSPVRCAVCKQPIDDFDNIVTDVDSGQSEHVTCPAARGSK